MSTVNKIIKILQIFLDYKEPITIGELSRLSGLNAGTLYRVILPLRKEGYINRQTKSSKYTIGPKFLEFGNHAKSLLDIQNIAKPYLVKLHDFIDESVQVAISNGEIAICKLILHGTQKLRIVMGTDAEFPLYCTGIGKVFLSCMTNQELERYFTKQGTLNEYTANTVCNLPRLKKQLLEIRRSNVSIDQEEYIKGIIEIAVPLKNNVGRIVAAIGILLPSSRASKERISELTTLLKQTALDISMVLQ
jgi:IclR family KDG regulon transcriptional repressor